MAWLSNPFKSLRISDDEEIFSVAGGVATGGSVKKDLSEIGETIGRQFRGFATFLAPPPPPPSSPQEVGQIADEDSSDTRSPSLAGIRNDLAEISGSFKSSFSLISSKKAVNEISKLASNFLRQNEEGAELEKDDHGVGVTDEVVDFVTEISQCPECWTDFPLSVNHDDFSMTQTQAEHISVMEQIVPTVADLRIRLSSDMNERQFWMIYFILVIPRLDKTSLNLLSTPEVIEARNTLLTMLRNKRNSLKSDSKRDHPSQSDGKSNQKENGKSVSDEKMSPPVKSVEGTSRKFSEEEDISFSDLDGDDTDHSIGHYGTGRRLDAVSYSSDGSSEWVRLNKNAGGRPRKGQLSSRNRDSEGEESSDWLKIHEFDYFN